MDVFAFMDRSQLRILYAAAIILEVLGEIVAQSFGGSGYLVLAVVGTLSLVSLISAIINVARLKRWGWVMPRGLLDIEPAAPRYYGSDYFQTA